MKRKLTSLLGALGLALVLLGMPALLIATHNAAPPRFGWLDLQDDQRGVVEPPRLRCWPFLSERPPDYGNDQTEGQCGEAQEGRWSSEAGFC